jgi:hypothetical protein
MVEFRETGEIDQTNWCFGAQLNDVWSTVWWPTYLFHVCSIVRLLLNCVTSAHCITPPHTAYLFFVCLPVWCLPTCTQCVWIPVRYDFDLPIWCPLTCMVTSCHYNVLLPACLPTCMMSAFTKCLLSCRALGKLRAVYAYCMYLLVQCMCQFTVKSCLVVANGSRT